MGSTTIIKHILHIIPIIAFGYIGIFLYPKWLDSGYLDDWYPRIGAGIAVYGGFVGNLIWYITNRKFL